MTKNKNENLDIISNCPTINSNIKFNSITVSAIPPGTNWMDLEGFINRKYGPFEFTIVNFKDEVVAKINFYFAYSCKGSYENHGAYLQNVLVAPSLLYAASGYSINCDIASDDPINYGTKINPIAGVILRLNMKIIGYEKFHLTNNTKYELNNLHKSVNQDCINLPNELFKEITSCKISNNSYGLDLFATVCIRGDGMVEIISVANY